MRFASYSSKIKIPTVFTTYSTKSLKPRFQNPFGTYSNNSDITIGRGRKKEGGKEDKSFSENMDEIGYINSQKYDKEQTLIPSAEVANILYNKYKPKTNPKTKNNNSHVANTVNNAHVANTVNAGKGKGVVSDFISSEYPKAVKTTRRKPPNPKTKAEIDKVTKKLKKMPKDLVSSITDTGRLPNGLYWDWRD